jgi:hypothetical protein
MRKLTQQEIDQAPAGLVCYMIREDTDTPMYLHHQDPFAWVDSLPIPRKEFNFSKYVFECTRVRNDTLFDDECVFIATPHSTGFISKKDTIALAKRYKLTAEDLK